MERRRRDLQIVNGRYKKVGTAGVCTYCGCPGDAWDHVPPLVMAPEEIRPEDGYIPHWLVASCRECNLLIGASPVLSLTGRRIILRSKYERKYKKYLSIPEWGHSERLSLGKNMRSKVKNGLRIKRAVEARIGVLLRPLNNPDESAGVGQ